MQKRVVHDVLIEATGTDTPPTSFQLVARLTHQARKYNGQEWWTDTQRTTPPTKRTVVATLTRTELAKLITDAAEWLAFVTDETQEEVAEA